ncbi:MAG: ribosomal-processing cysteine protease Prp [Spirochaetales bacterium]|nr:ribosomal-processing cysteine protease Prp [Spirochaetales bacterium]
MIGLKVSVGKNGNLESVRAEGHSFSNPRGSNIVCAAVSSQLRSLVRVVESLDYCDYEIETDDGFLLLVIKHCKDQRWLSGITDMLLSGLIETERDFPEECKLELTKKS